MRNVTLPFCKSCWHKNELTFTLLESILGQIFMELTMSEKYYDITSKDSEYRRGRQDKGRENDESLWDIFRQKHETELNIAYRKTHRGKDSGDHHR